MKISIEDKKIAWLRVATGLRGRLIDIYALPGFEPNGAGPARIFWGFRMWKLIPDWWPLTVTWRNRWKLTACADYHDFLYHLGGDETDRTMADCKYSAVLEVARDEIKGFGPLARLRRRRMLRMKFLYTHAVQVFGKDSFRYTNDTVSHRVC